MKKFIASLFTAVLFFSCSSDDVKSSENYIASFSLPNIKPVQITIINEQNTVHILTNQDISGIEPDIVPSKGASVKKEGANKYTITAENGNTRQYSVVVSNEVPKINKFEEWKSNDYYYLSDLNWASGNTGISTALQLLKRDKTNPENYPTKKTTDGYNSSNAVVLETMEGGTVYNRKMPILSGNFFLGNFNTIQMVTDELKATEFGKLYFAKPKSIKGYYKYKEGDGSFINGDSHKNDSCDIYAALYQASDKDGEEIILTAKDTKDKLDKSPYVIAHSRLQDCSSTQGTDFHQFVLNLNYKSEPDFEKYNYKLFITFAASKGGATYEGKIGSKLVVDEVEIEDY